MSPKVRRIDKCAERFLSEIVRVVPVQGQRRVEHMIDSLDRIAKQTITALRRRPKTETEEEKNVPIEPTRANAIINAINFRANIAWSACEISPSLHRRESRARPVQDLHRREVRRLVRRRCHWT